MDEAEEELQHILDEKWEEFITAVGQGRNLDQSQV